VTALLSLEAAVRAVLDRATRLSAEQVPLAATAGRVLAEPALAPVDLPLFPSSAMDGYALRADETPGCFPVVYRIAAGRPSPDRLAPGEAMAIATGGVVPDGADTVVPIERVTETDGEVAVPSRAEAGSNVRPRGGDVAAGTELVAAGSRIGPAQIGALGAAGLAGIVCARRPRVAIVTTGTELRPPGTTLAPGEIFESNGPMLASQLAAAGGDVEEPVSVPDDEAAHRAAIERGLELDVLVTSGGVSVGPHDLVRRIEQELGVEEVFWGVAVKPGKPVSFGVRGETLVFGLPGNPVSSLVACELFVRPALSALQGAADPGPRFEVSTLIADVERDPSRDVLVRAVARLGEQGVELAPLVGQDSHMIARAAAANALALIPRGDGVQAAGSTVRYLRISD
jgi:molybdopterin molybdotransferase